MSDLCKVNRSLALEIQQVIGSTWKPRQILCALHFSLALSEGIKFQMIQYQTKIETEKLFPKTVSFEMEMEDKTIAIQVLDC